MMLTKLPGVPANISAILWDMDGVLIDSLGFDIAATSRILKEITGIEVPFSADVIRGGFALSPEDYWPYLAQQAGLALSPQQMREVIALYEAERRSVPFPLMPAVEARLEEGREAGLKMAVVSNTPMRDLMKILENTGLAAWLDHVQGNDLGPFRKKPFPDNYLHAAGILGTPIEHCIVVEDSLIGAEAGHRSGAFTIGVATGGASLAELEASGFCRISLPSLEDSQASCVAGKVA